MLRRFTQFRFSKTLCKNRQFLLERRQDQLKILQKLKDNVNEQLLNCSIEELIKINAKEVFNTFASRCLLPQIQNLNGLADMNIERALKTNSYGVPFSVKDHLKVEGMIESCGFSDNLTPATESSDVVQLLEKNGCVAYTHTNVPQGLLGIESGNNVYGTSLNPFNNKFISGGSSGGQAVQVSTKASVFGLGSDSGGSVRIPAAFCGIYGYKPTGSKRFSIKGRVGPGGREGPKVGDLDPSMGYLTRSVDDLKWLCERTLGKSIYQQNPYIYNQWNESQYEKAKSKKLRFGYIDNYQQMKIAQGIVNSIRETVSLLRNDGHQVVEFKFPQLTKFRDFFFQYCHLINFTDAIFNRLGEDEVASQLQFMKDLFFIGPETMLKTSNSEQQRQLINLFLQEKSAVNFLKLHFQNNGLKNKFLKQWKDQNIDLLLSPTMPFTAPLKDTTKYLVFQLTFCAFQNVIQLPAGVIPTRLVQKKQTQYIPNNLFQNEVAQSIHQSEGLPIAIQLTGQHMKDQQCIGAMWQIEKLINNSLSPMLK